MRKLTAVMAADVVNYSGQIKQDEAATLAELRDLRRQLFEPLIGDHDGEVVKSMGDGWLVEFGAVADAVRCALDVQTGLRGRSVLKLRVGVHLGDVVHDEEDIYGDGVNLAARLQEGSEPGSVLISDIVHRSLDNRLADMFRRAGERRFKNIPEPLRVYQWSPPETAPARVVPPGRKDALMIGVLPFDNLSPDPEHEFFADGIAEEIITTLSKLPGLLVVARNSTFAYKGRSVDVKQVGIEQGIDLILEGSVRSGGSRVRITAQLIDTRTGMHRWADRYDRSLEDIFGVQDEIALRIATELQVELLQGEMARFRGTGTRNLRAWAEQLQALEAARQITAACCAEARRHAERAIALDPRYPAPLCTLGFVCTVEARHGFSNSRERSLTEARDCARRALELESYNPEAHAVAGFADAIDGDLDAAIAKFGRALELNPNHADVAARLSLTLAFNGQFTEAIRMARQAITLNPFYPGWYAGVLGFALRLDGQYAPAAAAFREYSQVAEGFGHVDLAIIHAATGELEAARREAENVLTHRPGFTIAAWEKTQLFADPGWLERDRLLLRKAGLPG